MCNFFFVVFHTFYSILLAVYKKHYPPSLADEVWRLEKIGKDGAFHKRLNKENIRTVKDFLTLLSIDSQRLRSVIFIFILFFLLKWFEFCMSMTLVCGTMLALEAVMDEIYFN